jgi:hypothetical protein
VSTKGLTPQLFNDGDCDSDNKDDDSSDSIHFSCVVLVTSVSVADISFNMVIMSRLS